MAKVQRRRSDLTPNCPDGVLEAVVEDERLALYPAQLRPVDAHPGAGRTQERQVHTKPVVRRATVRRNLVSQNGTSFFLLRN